MRPSSSSSTTTRRERESCALGVARPGERLRGGRAEAALRGGARALARAAGSPRPLGPGGPQALTSRYDVITVITSRVPSSVTLVHTMDSRSIVNVQDRCQAGRDREFQGHPNLVGAAGAVRFGGSRSSPKRRKTAFSSGASTMRSSPGRIPIEPWPLRTRTGAISMSRSPMASIDAGCSAPVRHPPRRPQSTVGAEISKVRPVVVVSHNEMNRYLRTVVVCPLTTSLHPAWRSRIQVQCAGRDAEIAVDQIRTISKRRLKKRGDRLTLQARPGSGG